MNWNNKTQKIAKQFGMTNKFKQEKSQNPSNLHSHFYCYNYENQQQEQKPTTNNIEEVVDPNDRPHKTTKKNKHKHHKKRVEVENEEEERNDLQQVNTHNKEYQDQDPIPTAIQNILEETQKLEQEYKKLDNLETQLLQVLQDEQENENFSNETIEHFQDDLPTISENESIGESRNKCGQIASNSDMENQLNFEEKFHTVKQVSTKIQNYQEKDSFHFLSDSEEKQLKMNTTNTNNVIINPIEQIPEENNAIHNELEKSNETKEEEPTPIPVDIQKICINLRTLSKIEVGEKLSLKEDKLLEIDKSYFSFAKRLVRGNSRSEAMEFLNGVMANVKTYILSSFEKLANGVNKKDERNQLVNDILSLHTSLSISGDGFVTLKQTYSSDVGVTSQIDRINQLRSQYISDIAAGFASVISEAQTK